MKDLFEIRESVTLESQGKKLFGILHRPKGVEKCPAVLFCHGFGGNKSGKYRLFVRLAEALAKVGIASLRFDFRGAGDSEGNFEDTTIKSQVEDAESALQYLLHHPSINHSKIALLGRSLGGLVSVLTASFWPQFKAIGLWAAVFDGKPWQNVYQSKKEESKKKERGTIEFDADSSNFVFQGTILNKNFIRDLFSLDMGKELQKISHIPLLYVHAGLDTIVDAYHDEQYKKIRSSTDAPTKHITLHESDHDFHFPKEQNMLLQITTEWFSQYLK